MTRAIAFGRSFISAPRDDGRRYTVSEAVDVLMEQGWRVVPREYVVYEPKAVEAPCVLARLKTLCGCTRDIFKPRVEHLASIRIPIMLGGNVRNWMSVDQAREVTFGARDFRFDSYERAAAGGVTIAHYLEQP